MTARNQTADLLKGIAVLLMIQVHIVELFASHGVFESSMGQILLFLGGPPVAPVYTILLGYFIMAEKKSGASLIIRGLKIIGAGMLLNIALNLNLIISVQKGLYQIDLMPYIFGVDILLFAGISILLVALLKKALEQSLLFVICLMIVSAFSGRFLLTYIPESLFLKYSTAFFYGSSQWSYFPLFPWISYPLAGIALYHLKQRYAFVFLQELKVKIVLGILFLLLFALTIHYAVSVASDLPLYYHHGLLFFVWVILFVFFYSFFINELNNKFGETVVFNYLKWLGENVTVIYIIQWIIIGNIATEIYQSISNPLYLAMSFLGVLFFSSCLAYLVTRIKSKL